jgi:hypothetical protein
MICPEHPEVTCRDEYDPELGYTGFCLKCCKHHLRCMEVHYMEMCTLQRGHADAHISKLGTMWTVNPDGSYSPTVHLDQT